METAKTADPTAPQQKPSHRFTTYERDANGSDEAMHRRYNSVRTRFEQPDPFAGSYDLTNPQSFNRYSYVQNDPVSFVDPTGLTPIWTCSPSADVCVSSWSWGPVYVAGGLTGLRDPDTIGGGRPIGTRRGVRRPQNPPAGQNFLEIRFSFRIFLTNMSQNCRTALAGFISDLTNLADTASFFDVDRLGDQPALGYFGYGEEGTLGQAFNTRRTQRGAEVLSVNEPAGVNTNRHGIYFRSGEMVFRRPTGMYLLLHEMMHLLVAPTADPRRSGDEVLGRRLGLELRGGENWSHAVSRYFSSECDPREVGP